MSIEASGFDFAELERRALEEGRVGRCPECGEEERVPCSCGVCLQDCHPEASHAAARAAKKRKEEP